MPVPDLDELESAFLAPYAALSRHSRGREHPSTPDHHRTEYQRDRDRIIHCAAFRKLEYKTQVYMVHHGDYFRTRITHTMEVAQIARTLARNLRLNPDLTEAIALAHDLGHTPFGHSGEMALKRLLVNHGGFEHNEQGLRVVEILEEKYPAFPGLNLTWEVREGIIKHASEYDSPEVPDRFNPQQPPTLESQLCDVADEIAYNNHDIDDALKMALITEKDLDEVDWLGGLFHRIRSQMPPGTADKYVRFKAIGEMITQMVTDVIDTTTQNLETLKIKCPEDVRNCSQIRLVSFSKTQQERNRAMKNFLMARVYRHPAVVRMNTKSEYFIERLFNLYTTTPAQLPIKHQKRIEHDGLFRVVTDYLSGMTDRYLQEDYIRAFEPERGNFL